MKFKFWTKIVLLLMVLTLIGGCIFLPQKKGYVRIAVYSGDPNNPSSVVSSLDTLFVGIDGLEPFNRYDVEIQNSDGTTMAKYVLNATQEGKLPPTAMWPDAGLPPVVNDGPVDPRSDIQVGSYKIILKGEDDSTDVMFPFSVISRTTPTVWSSNINGDITNGYLEGVDTVYATGMNFVKNANVDIYIMRDKDSWNYGEFLNDPNSYLNKVAATTDEGGILSPTNLGLAAIDTAHGDCRNFDIIVDANQDGIFDPKDTVDGKNCAGYTVEYNPDMHQTQNLYKLQLASNGHALDYSTHWNDTFYYPDQFNQDGSDTGFPWMGFGQGVFCILNPLIDETDGTGLVYWQQVQVWVIKTTDFDNLAANGNNLAGLDVSDSQGRPDLVWVQRTCSNGAGSILIWQAPLVDRRSGQPAVVEGDGFVVIVEKPDQYGVFENKYHPATDYIDGDLNGLETDNRGFNVVNVQ